MTQPLTTKALEEQRRRQEAQSLSKHRLVLAKLRTEWEFLKASNKHGGEMVRMHLYSRICETEARVNILEARIAGTAPPIIEDDDDDEGEDLERVA